MGGENLKDSWYRICNAHNRSLDAFNAMGDLVGAPPIIINETVLTLEHVMQRLDAIEKKMVTEE